MTAGEATSRQRLGRSFRLYWMGQSASYVGSHLTDFVLPVIAAVVLRANPLWLGAMVAAGQVPYLLAPLYAGPLADRYSRWLVIMTTDVVRFAIVCCIPLLAWAHLLTSPVLVGLVLLHGLTSVTYEVTSFAYVPDIVHDTQLAAANGAIHGSHSVAQVAGPGIAGLLLAVVAAPVALLVDAATYAVSIALLLVSGAGRATARPAPGPRRGLFGDAVDGMRVVWRTPALRTLNLSSGQLNFWASAGLSVFAIYVLRDLRLNPTQFGAAMAIGALGGVVGAAVGARMSARFGLARMVPILLVLASIEDAILVMAKPSAQEMRAAVLITAMVAGGVIAAAYMVLASTIRQLASDPEVRGRVAASMRFFTRGTMPLGALAGGALGTLASPVTVLAICSFGQFLTGWWCWRRRHDLVTRAAEPAPVG
jgi:MFS family permease